MAVLLVTILLAVSPMTEPQRALSQQTSDRAGFDEAGLYALLDNVRSWKPGDEAGAQVPDYAALMSDPAAHRGEPYLLEGRFAGRSRRVGLANPGEWGEAVTEWVILTSNDPSGGDVAVIFFVDPKGELPVPAKGRRVRATGRFYKVWSDRDAHGNPTDYLLFVARHPTLSETSGGGGGLSQGQTMLTALLVVIVAAAAVLVVLRRSVVKPIAPRRLSRPDAQDTADQLEEHLPVDPADALEALEREHQEP